MRLVAILVPKRGRRITFDLDTWQPLWTMACREAYKATREDWLKGVDRDGQWITEHTAGRIANSLTRFLNERSWIDVRRWVSEEFSEDRILSRRMLHSFITFCRSSGGFTIGGLE